MVGNPRSLKSDPRFPRSLVFFLEEFHRKRFQNNNSQDGLLKPGIAMHTSGIPTLDGWWRQEDQEFKVIFGFTENWGKPGLHGILSQNNKTETMRI